MQLAISIFSSTTLYTSRCSSSNPIGSIWFKYITRQLIKFIFWKCYGIITGFRVLNGSIYNGYIRFAVFTDHRPGIWSRSDDYFRFVNIFKQCLDFFQPKRSKLFRWYSDRCFHSCNFLSKIHLKSYSVAYVQASLRWNNNLKFRHIQLLVVKYQL